MENQISQTRATKMSLWHIVALSVIMALAIFLHFYNLHQEGYGNLYYAAAVKSMLLNWHNFFFVSFDPAGFVSVDKPPLGLWVQAAFAAALGFSGLSVHLPQAIAGVLSVWVLFVIVKRTFGVGAALIAALVLTLTPISIAANRNNTMDSQLVLTSLLAAWAALVAAERGQLRWLLLSAIWIGIGFNIKMLQAFMIVPAVFGAYFIAAPVSIFRRLWHSLIAAAVMLIISLSWAVVVDLTPPGLRPYVGSSDNNTVMELIVGHNGASRLGALGGLLGIESTRHQPPAANTSSPTPRNDAPDPQGNAPRGMSNETGEAGVFRLFNEQLGGQASWLLPMAFVCAIAAAWQSRFRWPLSAVHTSMLFWLGWLVPQVVFFSFAGLFHRYYLEMLSPAIAALVGAGLASLWIDYTTRHWRGWLLPAVMAIGLATNVYLVLAFPEWAVWIIVGSVSLFAVSALALWTLRALPHNRWLSAAQGAAFAAALAGLFIAPAAWSLTPVLYGGDAGLPYASPALGQNARGSVGGAQNRIAVAEPVLTYIQSQNSQATYTLATLNANSAAPFILSSDEVVIALGGFSGRDAILNESELAEQVASGEMRFFLLSADNRQPAGAPPQPFSNNPPKGGNPPPFNPSANAPPNAPSPNQASSNISRWVTEHCALVSLNQQETTQPLGQITLFDCAAKQAGS